MRVASTVATFLLAVAIAPAAWAQDGGRMDAGRLDASAPDGGMLDGATSEGGAPDAADPPPEPPLRAVARDPAAVVARGRNLVVTAGDVVAAINAHPAPLRGAFVTPSELDRAGDELVRDRLLAAEARRRGLDRDPRVRAEIDRLLGRAVLDPLVDASLRETVSAQEVQRYYDAHLPDFTRPERVRTSVIVLEDQPAARRILGQVRSRPAAFRGLVRRYSTDRRSRVRGGDAGWWDRVGGGTDPALVDAAFALGTPGQFVDRVVATEDELFYVIRLDERRAAEQIPLSELRVTIESRIRRDRLGTLADHVTATLARQAQLGRTPASRVVRMVAERAPAATVPRDGGVPRDAGR